MNVESCIARRVKEFRTARGWSLDELAARSGVSRAMISRIERRTSSPTAGLLAKLVDALGVTLSALMTPPRAEGHAINRRDEQMQWQDPASGYGRRLVSPPGPGDEAEILAIDLPAGARVAYPAAQRMHYDQQVLVLQGQLQVWVGAELVDLGPGDCLRMPLDEPHAFVNPTRRPTRYLVVVRGSAGLAQEGAA